MRERQAETLALLGVQALRQRPDSRAGEALVLTEALEATRRLLHADHAVVLDVRDGADDLQVRASSPHLDARIEVPSGSRSFAGYTTLARKVVIVDNADQDGRFDARPTPSGRPAVSAIGAPIFGPHGIRGVLIAESSIPNRFDDLDGHFVQSMANIIGTALLS
jgi:GAF domain-containing protein